MLSFLRMRQPPLKNEYKCGVNQSKRAHYWIEPKVGVIFIQSARLGLLDGKVAIIGLKFQMLLTE